MQLILSFLLNMLHIYFKDYEDKDSLRYKQLKKYLWDSSIAYYSCNLLNFN